MHIWFSSSCAQSLGAKCLQCVAWRVLSQGRGDPPPLPPTPSPTLCKSPLLPHGVRPGSRGISPGTYRIKPSQPRHATRKGGGLLQGAALVPDITPLPQPTVFSESIHFISSHHYLDRRKLDLPSPGGGGLFRKTPFRKTFVSTQLTRFQFSDAWAQLPRAPLHPGGSR